MSSNNDELNLPWKIYFFNEHGKYNPNWDVFTVERKEDFEKYKKLLSMQNNAGLEIRVCDSLDYCIMHFKDGKRIFP